MDSSTEVEKTSPLAHVRIVTSGVLLVLLTGISFFSWRALSEVVLGNSSHWIVLFGWFSAVMIFTMLGSLLWKEFWLKILGIGGVFLPGLLWGHTLWHVVMVGIGGILMYIALSIISFDLMTRIQVNPFRSLHHNSTWLVVGISLVIASQYYTYADNLRWEQLIPKFDVTQGMGAWAVRLVGQIYVPARELEKKETTVDSFLLDVQERESAGHPLLGGLPQESLNQLSEIDRAALQKLVLARQRQELSRILGREVDGQERVSTLISEMLHKKTLALVQDSEIIPEKVPLIPFILSVLLFLTVYPVGAFLVPLWASFAAVLFRVIRRFHWIALRRTLQEQEEIL